MAGKMTHDALSMIEYRDDPAVLLLADSPEAANRARPSALAAGCRIRTVIGLEEGISRLGDQIALDAVLVEVSQDHGSGLDRLLERINHSAAVALHGSVVSGPPEMIDAIAARTPHASVLHLVEPSECERMDALARAMRRRPVLLHDAGKNGSPVQLQQLSEEVGRIASLLATLSEADSGTESPEPDITPQHVRNIIRARRLRDQYFGTDIFADPAWDMLLDLMAARLEQQRVAVSSLCIAASVPATTALRWIKALTEQGLFDRCADPQDGRRVYIELSDSAASAMLAYLRAAQRISPLLS